MFGFSPSKEQKMVKDSFSEVVRDFVAVNAHDWDESGEIPADFIQKTWELGACVAAVPDEFGGDGMAASPVLNALILEELAAGDMAFAAAAMLPGVFIGPILEDGTDAQKKKYLPACCGEKYAPVSLAMTEPFMDFDPAAPKTAAERKGGSYIINGKKCFAAKAKGSKYVMVSAMLDGKPQIFIVDGKNPGMAVGGREKTLGLYALDLFPVTFENCEIPAEDRLGGDAGCNHERVLAKSRTAMAAMAAGICRASFDFVRKYARERVQFGEPIAHRQAVAFMIAQMAYETDAIRLLAWKAASALEAGKNGTRESYLAKLYAAETGMLVCDFGVQVMGGHGYIRDYPAERYYRNVRGAAMIEGLASV